MNLVKEVYILIRQFPKEELYALTTQTRRAVVSVPANIAEGMGRQYKKDTLQFLYIARGSVYELETLLNIAVMVGILSDTDMEALVPQIDETLKLLNGFINYLSKANLK